MFCWINWLLSYSHEKLIDSWTAFTAKAPRLLFCICMALKAHHVSALNEILLPSPEEKSDHEIVQLCVEFIASAIRKFKGVCHNSITVEGTKKDKKTKRYGD
jgi:hypothetical protein